MTAQNPTMAGTIAYLSIPWDEQSPLTFLRRSAHQPRIYWESDRSPLAFAGFGITAQIEATGTDRFSAIKAESAALLGGTASFGEASPSWIGPRLFGGFAFEPASEPDPAWEAFPDAAFILPRYLLTRCGNETWLTVSKRVRPNDATGEIEWDLRELIWDIPPHSTSQYGFSKNNGYPEFHFEGKMERQDWKEMVECATDRIRNTKIDKVVLARALDVNPISGIDPTMILGRLAGKYPNCYRFLFEPAPGRAFFGATPELLAKVDGNALTTMGLAGSIRRGDTHIEDLHLGEKLLETPKEREEHSIVVEEIERNLAPLVENMKISKTTLLKLSNIQHIFTPIEGDLLPNTSLLNIIEALHPTPAVGGIPRKDALDFIRNNELTPRGWYAAPVGWIGPGGNGEFAVALRSGVSNEHRVRLYAGAGIVADSQPEKEWRETNLKFRPMMENLYPQTEQLFSHEK